MVLEIETVLLGVVVSLVGVVTTFAGSGTAAFVDGTGTASSFNQPYGIFVSTRGVVYVADYGNNRIRQISSAGDVLVEA